MLLEKALGRYGDSLRGLLPDQPDTSLFADETVLPLIREIDRYMLRRYPDDPLLLERMGESYHMERRLWEAAAYYRRAIRCLPPTEPDETQRAAILRHAPLLHLTRDECFPLRDVIALHHPQKPLIAYHLFWEDDYDFPDDCDPCDHEQVWVGYEPEGGAVTAVWAFYHSRIISTRAAADDANRRGGRPNVSVQWGKHGSLLPGCGPVRLQTGTVREDMEWTWRDVCRGGRAAEHPIKRRFWPARYEGSRGDFFCFPVEVDSRELLEKKRCWLCTPLSNAVIGEYFLTYNFAAKFGWPWDAPVYGDGPGILQNREDMHT